MKIAIIGVGNLGESIAKGILSNENISFSSLYLAKRNVNTLSSWQNENNVTVTSSNTDAVKNSDIIILAIQPGQLNNVLEEIKEVVDAKRHTILSVITGRSVKQYTDILGAEIPVIRTMANTAISVGQSMTCITANEAGKKNIEIAETIFNALGKTLYIEEDMMAAATVICASGTAFWLRLIRASMQSAVQLGFEPEDAQELSMQTALGAISLLEKEDSHPEKEIDRVTTPNGCTIAGLNEMEHAGISSAFIKGVTKAAEKINEIKKK